MTGVPVVPLEEWMRTTFSSGTAWMPSGYASRRSAFSENGRRSKDSWSVIVDMSTSANFFA